MKTFKSFLNEILDQPYKINLVKKTDYDIYYTFTTSDGKKGLIMFELKTSILKPEFWELSFTIDTHYDVTGGGEAFTIFSTVMDALKEFLKIVDARVIKFSSAKTKNDSRSSLYSSLIKKFAKTYGYNSEIQKFISGSKYILTKNS